MAYTTHLNSRGTRRPHMVMLVKEVMYSARVGRSLGMAITPWPAAWVPKMVTNAEPVEEAGGMAPEACAPKEAEVSCLPSWKDAPLTTLFQHSNVPTS
eukprot:1141692-Pelagomonas_calceolata.AAC.7